MDKKLVIVTWIDASDPGGDNSWFTDAEVDDFASKECRVVSVGYIKSQTHLYITLVGDYILNDNGSYTWGRPTKVPLGMVESVKEVIP